AAAPRATFSTRTPGGPGAGPDFLAEDLRLASRITRARIPHADESYAQLPGCCSLDHARKDPQSVFDPSRDRVIAFCRRMTSRRVPIRNVQLFESRNNVSVPIQRDRLVERPLRQLGVVKFYATASTLDLHKHQEHSNNFGTISLRSRVLGPAGEIDAGERRTPPGHWGLA